MSKKEKELLRLLEYLSKKSHPRYSKSREGVYVLDDLSGDFAGCKGKDYWNFTVNFNDKTISLYSCNESYHNGDPYNSSVTSVDWKYLLDSYDSIRSAAKQYALKEAEEKVKDNLAEKRLQEILAGK